MSNLTNALAWRELVATLLKSDGHGDVTFKPGPRVSSTDDAASDIRGIPGWTFKTRNVLTRDLASGLAEAQAAARRDNAQHAVAVYRRHDSTGWNAYAVLSLADLSAILHELRAAAR